MEKGKIRENNINFAQFYPYFSEDRGFSAKLHRSSAKSVTFSPNVRENAASSKNGLKSTRKNDIFGEFRRNSYLRDTNRHSDLFRADYYNHVLLFGVSNDQHTPFKWPES